MGHVHVSHANPLLLSEFRWLLTALLLMSLYHSSVRQDWNNIKSSLPVIFFLAIFGQVLFPLTLQDGCQHRSVAAPQVCGRSLTVPPVSARLFSAP
ncbi:hypothetical protein Q0A17_05350 [Citrobacter sp. S2-9]|uniref:Uncharacterized protein n=1 Tax=Citrobacter enshiensis TaxID=2971264 RepID=A0ABT8PR71_9ENTR|nr:hypothetical protein [Citrobacter enshiensis]MDN8598842.1 hypothetical protein [Citrobacter enshiensis]